MNAEGRVRGLADPPLDDVGVAEAAALARELAEVRPNVIVSSPMQRAIATAEAVADATSSRVRIDARMQDRDYGEQSGRLESEVIDEFGSIDAAPGVEPLPYFGSRLRQGFDEIITEDGPGTIVIVAHDAINQALLRSLDDSLGQIRQRTGCWNKLVLRDGSWNIELVDQKASNDKP